MAGTLQLRLKEYGYNMPNGSNWSVSIDYGTSRETLNLKKDSKGNWAPEHKDCCFITVDFAYKDHDLKITISDVNKRQKAPAEQTISRDILIPLIDEGLDSETEENTLKDIDFGGLFRKFDIYLKFDKRTGENVDTGRKVSDQRKAPLFGGSSKGKAAAKK